MKIEGPLSIGIIDADVQQKRTLEINFKQEFQQLAPDQQLSKLKVYIRSLFQHAEMLQSDQADRKGILLIIQICEELLPHLQHQEMDLSETIELQMAAANASPEIAVSLTDLGMQYVQADSPGNQKYLRKLTAT